MDAIHENMVVLYKCCDCIALLDMLVAFAQLATTPDFFRPQITDTLAIQAGRHPIREKIPYQQKFVPNDVYSNQQTRFQIITGCNMSGKFNIHPQHSTRDCHGANWLFCLRQMGKSSDSIPTFCSY